MAEFDTWVPLVKKGMSAVPRPVGWAMAAAVTAIAIYCKPDVGLLLGGLAAGNYILMKIEYWTAYRDKVAIEAGVATGATSRLCTSARLHLCTLSAVGAHLGARRPWWWDAAGKHSAQPPKRRGL